MLSWHFWRIALEVYGCLALVATLGVTLGGFMWNRVSEVEPPEDEAADWALYAERTR